MKIPSVGADTPIPSGRMKVGNVTSEVDVMVMPVPAEEDPLVIKLLSLPDTEKETGVFKSTLTNEDNNESSMEVLSMEIGDIAEEDPARSKNVWNVDPHTSDPGVAEDAV